MDRKEDINVEMQQVGAYPTKHKMHQRNVPLLEDKEEDQGTQRIEQK
ncbi:MAG: hypothetical protein ACM32O_00285 [Clostridia bacterium]